LKIAVSGSSGLIGGAVAKRLDGANTIITLGRRANADIQVDFSKFATVSSIELSGCDALVHCAGVVDEDFKDDPHSAFLRATVAFEELINRAVASGVRRIAYFSTSHVYGPMRGRLMDGARPAPITNYAIAHYASEMILRRIAKENGLQALVLRPNAVFGMPESIESFDRWWLIPYSFPISAVTEGSISLRSRGAARRNFVSINDLAGYVELFLQEPDSERMFVTLNATGPDSYSIREFAELCAAECEQVVGSGCEVRVPVGAEPPEEELGSDFEYVTVNSHYVATDDVTSFLREFMPLIQSGQIPTNHK